MPRSNLVNAVDVALAADVAALDTTIEVDDASVLPVVPFYLVVDPFNESNGREYMFCTAVVVNTLTVDRELAGTEANTHLTGDVVRISYVAQILEDLWDEIDELLTLPGLGVNGESLRKLSSTLGDYDWRPNVTYAGTAPVTPLNGDFWQDTDDGIMYTWDGGAWVPVAGGYLPLAGGTMSGAINMGSQVFIEVFSITGSGGLTVQPKQDAVSNMDLYDGNGQRIRLLTGSDMAFYDHDNTTQLFFIGFGRLLSNVNLDMNLVNKVINLLDPTNPQDAATKNYIDNIIGGAGPFLELAGGTMAGIIDMGGNRISTLGSPIVSDDATPRSYVDAQDALYLPLAGGTMSGPINMGGQAITGLPTPSVSNEATNKSYVDGEIGNLASVYLALAGGTMTGNIDMGLRSITNIAFLKSNPGGVVTLEGQDAASGVWLAVNGAAKLTIDDTNVNIQVPMNMNSQGMFNVTQITAPAGADLLISAFAPNKLALAGLIQEGTVWANAAASGVIQRWNGDGNTDASRRYEWRRSTDFSELELHAITSASADYKVIKFSSDNAGTVVIGQDTQVGQLAHKSSFQETSINVNFSVDDAPTTGTAVNTTLVNVGTNGFWGGTRWRVHRFTSARKYKSNIQLAPQLADLALEPVTFHHDGDDKDYIGFIADDIPIEEAIVRNDGEVENYDINAVVAILAAKVNRLEDANA